MGNLVDASTRAAPEEVFRLKNIELSVPTDEQLKKARSKFVDAKAHVSLKVVWEPLSYKKFINNEPVQEEVEYIRITKGDGLSGLEEPETVVLERARQVGFHAIPAGVRISLPRGIHKADPEKQEQPFSRFMVYATKAGITVDIDEQTGAVSSPQIGQVFRCLAGYQDFPTPKVENGKFRWDWDEKRSSFYQFPLEALTDYRQPEDLPVRRYETAENAEGVTTAGEDDLTGQLVAAARVLQIDGQDTGTVNANALSLSLTKAAEAPALSVPEVITAAEQGRFVEYLVSKGVARVEDGKVKIG